LGERGGKRLADGGREISVLFTAVARGQFSERVGRNLVRVGYDPAYGARPLKRAIQREIETPMARMILGGEVRDGHQVLVDLDSTGKLKFKSKIASREREAALKEA